MDSLEMKATLSVIHSKVRCDLTADDNASILEDIHAGECMLAFEHICEQLYEYGASIEPATFRELEQVGRRMGMAPDNWEDLSVRSEPGSANTDAGRGPEESPT